MSKQKEIPAHGIHVDINRKQLNIVLVMFALLFLMPIFGYQFYLSTKKLPETSGTYTASSLNQPQTIVEPTTQANVAGVSTSKTEETVKSSTMSYKVPLLNINFTTDFSDPGNLMVIIGSILGIASIVVFAGVFFDLFKT